MVLNSRMEAAVAETRNLVSMAASLNTAKDLREDLARPEELSAAELISFDRSFRKNLRQASQTFDHSLTGIFSRHKIDIAVALLAAKKQIGGVFGGTDDPRGSISVIYNPEPAWFGLGFDDWHGATPVTAGSLQNWIHGGSTLLGGGAGVDAEFMENVVAVILGFGNYSVDYNRVTKLQARINTAPQQVMNVGSVWRNAHGDYASKVFELDSPIIVKNGTKLRIQCLSEGVVPNSEWIYPICAVFTKTSLTLEGDLASKATAFFTDNKIVKTA